MTETHHPQDPARHHGFVFLLPKHHLLAALGLAGLLGAGLWMVPADDAAAKRRALPVALPISQLPDTTLPKTPAEIDWKNITVKRGDNLSLIFQQVGLNDADIYYLTRRRSGRALSRIHPGERFSFHIDEQGDLQAVRHHPTRLKTVTFSRQGDHFSVQTVVREPQAHRILASATIQSSLYEAGLDANISHQVIMQLAQIYGGVIDFILDPRKGDRVFLLYEQFYLDGEKLGDGDILAAELVNKGKSYLAYRYIDETGRASYLNEKGVSMRKAFLMAPLDFTRVSSHFNPRRLHPIYKTRRPHRGTDYAAPRGTPVYASGDGQVVEAGYTRANGKYVVIRHGETYTSKYLHLHKIKVRNGQRVEQSDIVGTVGSTGAATGPHLHYEFLVNGVHRNPRTLHRVLPKARSLPAAELPRYWDQIRSFKMQLASIRQQKLAFNTAANTVE